MVRLTVSLAALVLGGAGILSAQTLEAGTWTGKITPPDSPPFPVTVKVTAAEESVSAELRWGDFGRFPLREIEVADDRITFTLMFGEGDALRCDLARQDDGSFAGDCVNEDDEPGGLILTPPSAEGDGE